jgi:lysine-ketoglutarate reductase/saccharopine dehydrogenase-like protein (TIGR00300 family)
MNFKLPDFFPPDFNKPDLKKAPIARFEEVIKPGVAPDNFHATSIFPEYLKMGPDNWCLLTESRMDCVVVKNPDNTLAVREFRSLKPGEMVAVGRTEKGEDGIFVYTEGFKSPEEKEELFAFRTQVTRESSFSIDYDKLYQLLDYERKNGFIVWVLGPAVVFDADAREAMVDLVEKGYVHALLAGNALATHDLEGSVFSTALGLEIYSKKSVHLGHYHHLETLNKIRGAGSMKEAVLTGLIKDGLMKKVVEKKVPFVLAGSIRDDGPLPEVVADVYKAQDQMRSLVRKGTTIMTLATQLHTIATGNMAPSYQVDKGGNVRPVYLYNVDMSEFAASKLANRGSLSASAILTNVQDFVVTVARGVAKLRK